MPTSQFKQRLLMGSLGIFAGYLCIYYSHAPYLNFLLFIVTGCIISFSLLEYYHLAEHKGYQPLTTLSIGCSIAYILSLPISFYATQFKALPCLIVLVTLLLFFLAFFRNHPSPLVNLAITVFGIVYLTIPLSTALQINYFFPLDGIEDGRLWLAYVLIVSKANDIGAYFFGKSVGKKKLAPSISPKKTIEGAIGGFVAGVLTSLGFFLLFHSDPTPSFKITLTQSLSLGVLISILAQLGDLTESLLKRDVGVKDSSSLPGFGGVLDLVDSLVFTLPMMYLLLEMRLIG